MTDDERIRVRARGGVEVEFSRNSARCADTLKNLMDDTLPADGVYPAPTISAAVLSTLSAMCEPNYVPLASLTERPISELLSLIEGAIYLDASKALEHAQCAVASRLADKGDEELRGLFDAVDDFASVEERAAALAEPMFSPDSHQLLAPSSGPPVLQPQPSLSGLPVTDDAMEVALAQVDVTTLAKLTGLNQTWRVLTRRVICSRLCRVCPMPADLADITDLDVELLDLTGRRWEVAAAGRWLTNLARLHGYGFVVDVNAVRSVDLQNEDDGDGDGEEDDGDDDGEYETGWLRGAAKAALHSCIIGEGEPPLELMQAAIACAGSGEVHSIPVEAMRGDSLTALDLSHNHLSTEDAMLVASLVPFTRVLANLDVRHTGIVGDGASQLSAAVLANTKIDMFNAIPIKGMRSDSFTLLDLEGKGIGAIGGMVVASLVAATTKLTSLDLSNNQLCGLDSLGPRASRQLGTYTGEGIKAVADALRINTSLTIADMRYNSLDAESARMFVTIAKEKRISLCGIEPGQTGADFSYVTTRRYMQTADAVLLTADLADRTSLTALDLSRNHLGPGAKELAPALIRTALIRLDLSKNYLYSEGAAALAPALAANTTMMSCDLRGNQLDEVGWCAVFDALRDNPQNKIKVWELAGQRITATIAKSLVAYIAISTSLTSLNLANNVPYGSSAGPAFAKALAPGIAASASLTSINLSSNNIGGHYVQEAKLPGSGRKVGAKLQHEGVQWTIVQETDEDGDVLICNTAGVIALAVALSVNTSLMSCNVLSNNMDVAAANLLVEAVKDKDISLCGIKPEQKEASFSRDFKPPDEILLASDLSKAGVTTEPADGTAREIE